MKRPSLLRVFFLFIFLSVFGVGFLAAQDNSICATPDTKPFYSSGNKGLVKFLKENVAYPAAADTIGYTGTVCVSFIVEKSGGLSSIEISKGIGKGCDEEALRVVRKMPKWIAGTKAGKTVRVAYKLYIAFPQPE